MDCEDLSLLINCCDYINCGEIDFEMVGLCFLFEVCIS